MQQADLSAIADGYDAILCDVWGVVHDGRQAFGEAVEALKRFRENHGPVILITNAPVPHDRVEALFPKLGVDSQCYDAVISSGDATRAELMKYAPGPIYRLGPDYDDPLYHGLEVEFSDGEDAVVVSCTGLRHMPDDDPKLYREELEALAALGLDMICANPDIVYRHGDKLIWAAGSLAQLYEDLGGEVIRPGKPDNAIYQLALDKVEELCGAKLPRDRVLAIGDGPVTDILGAQKQGLDCLFIGGGIHGEALGDGQDFILNAEKVLTKENTSAKYASPFLSW